MFLDRELSSLAVLLGDRSLLNKASQLSTVLWDAVQYSKNPVSVLEIVEDPQRGRKDYSWVFANQAYQAMFWDNSPRSLGQRLSQVAPQLPDAVFRQFDELEVGGSIDIPSIYAPPAQRWFDCRVRRSSSDTLTVIFTETIHVPGDGASEPQRALKTFRALFMGGGPKLLLSRGLMVLEANPQALAYYGWAESTAHHHHFGDLFDSDVAEVEKDLAEGLEVRVALQWHRSSSGHRQVELHSYRIFVGDEWYYVVEIHDRESYGQKRVDWSLSQVPFRPQGRAPTRPPRRSEHLEAFRSRYSSTAPAIDSLIDSLAGVGRRVRLKKGDLLVRMGGSASASAVSANGYFRTFLFDDSANEVTLGFFHPGQVVSSYYSMVRNMPSELSIEALNDCEVFLMDSTSFYNVVLADHAWYSVLFMLLQEGYFLKERRELSLLTQKPRERYLSFLQTFPDLVRHLKQYHIASYLGVTPETLSRYRSEIQRDDDDFS